MKPVAVSLGGSILLGNGNDGSGFKDFSDAVSSIRRRVPLAIVTGGGRVAREYISIARETRLPETFQDRIGIAVTRVNAEMLAAHMGISPFSPPRSVRGGVSAFNRDGFVIMGGVKPGQTTDAVCAELAAGIGASRMVNVTAVPGVYTADPRKTPDARRYKTLDYGTLRRVCGMVEDKPGVNVVVDRKAVETLEANGLELVVVGPSVRDLASAIAGKRVDGTIVAPGCRVTYHRS